MIVKIDSPILGLQQLAAGNYPNMARAFQDALRYTKGVWVDLARTAFQRPTGGYIGAILAEQDTDNPFRGTVGAYSKTAEVVEYGHAGFNMKRMLNTSDKVRWIRLKRGKHYVIARAIIIPFRHGTPEPGDTATGPSLLNANPSSVMGGNRATMRKMPVEIYQKAKALDFSQTVAVRPVGLLSRAQAGAIKGKLPAHSASLRGLSGGGYAPVNRRTYQWGTRLSAADTAGFGELPERQLPNGRVNKATRSIYEGMVKMNRGRQTEYVTFRILHEFSTDSWNVPPRAGMHFVPKVEAMAGPVIEDMIRRGFEADLQAIRT